MIYLYDPRTNLLTETSYSYLEELTGKKRANLASYKSLGRKIGNINCYLVDEDVTVQQRKAWYEKEKFHNEVWKVIYGSEEKFLVSNYGRFKRIFKNHTSFLLPFLMKRAGYMLVKVKFNGVYKDHKVATIVAHHFVGKPKPGQVLLHKNLIKTDDYFANLEYVSKKVLGERTGFKSRSKAVIQFDRFTGEVLGEFKSAREAGRKCFLSYQSVMDCCNGKHKSSGGIYVFKWADEYENEYSECEKE